MRDHAATFLIGAIIGLQLHQIRVLRATIAVLDTAALEAEHALLLAEQ